MSDRLAVDRRLYLAASAVVALIMLVGFSRTYYLSSVFNAPPLSGLLHVHGFVMTLWFFVFLAQVGLVARKRADLHRRLGWIAVGLAPVVVVLGLLVAIAGGREGHTVGGLPPLVFMMIPMSIMVIFATLVALAIRYRRQPAIHKRLMLIASVNMITPAIFRLPLKFIAAGGPKVAIGLTIAILLACAGYDTIRNRKLHPAFGWGIGLLIVSFPIRFALAGTDGWLHFAAWLVG